MKEGRKGGRKEGRVTNTTFKKQVKSAKEYISTGTVTLYTYFVISSASSRKYCSTGNVRPIDSDNCYGELSRHHLLKLAEPQNVYLYKAP